MLPQAALRCKVCSRWSRCCLDAEEADILQCCNVAACMTQQPLPVLKPRLAETSLSPFLFFVRSAAQECSFCGRRTMLHHDTNPFELNRSLVVIVVWHSCT